MIKNWREGKLKDEVKSGKKSKKMVPWHLLDNKAILGLARGFPTTLAVLIKPIEIEGMSKEKMSNGGLLQKVFAGFPSEILWGKCSERVLFSLGCPFLFTCRVLKR